MSGYWHKSRTQELDQFDNLIPGARAYFYAPGSASLPMRVYSDVTLGEINEHPHPVVADGNARWPQVFFDSNTWQYYDLRVTDAGGALLYEDRSVPIIAQAVAGGGGGEPPPPVEQAALAKTGDVKLRFGYGAEPGWARMNGGTIGRSSGSESVGTVAQKLYEHLWNNFASKTGNVICPVIGGLGLTAAADWEAPDKPITLPDMRGRVPAGVDRMGSGISSDRIGAAYMDSAAVIAGDVGGTPRDTVGGFGGDDEIALTTAQLAAHSHDATGVPAGPGGTPAALPRLTVPAHTHFLAVDVLSSGAALSATNHIARERQSEGEENYALRAENPSPAPALVPTLGLSSPVGPVNIPGNTGSTGSGSAHETLQPFMLFTYYIKL